MNKITAWDATDTTVNNTGQQAYEQLYEDAFFDWETSDGNLRDLEQRIASFCANGLHGNTRPNSHSRSQRAAVKALKRFEVEVTINFILVFWRRTPDLLLDDQNHNKGVVVFIS